MYSRNQKNCVFRKLYFSCLTIALVMIIAFIYNMFSTMNYGLQLSMMTNVGVINIVAPMISSSIQTALWANFLINLSFVILYLWNFKLLITGTRRKDFLLSFIVISLSYIGQVLAPIYFTLNYATITEDFLSKPTDMLYLGNIFVGTIWGISIFPEYIIWLDLLSKAAMSVCIIFFFEILSKTDEVINVTDITTINYILYISFGIYIVSLFVPLLMYIVRLAFFMLFLVLSYTFS
ncbi:MAG: hypothetical protein Q6351_009075 [Candidatus Njordarchaeum guaymaensis]